MCCGAVQAFFALCVHGMLVSRCAPGNVRQSVAAKEECLPGARPAHYLSINYPEFTPRYTL